MKNEGLARDIVRNVQNLRKETGLDIADRITLGLVTKSDALAAAINQCRDYVANETLAVEIAFEPLRERTSEKSVDIDGPQNAVTIMLAKAC